MKEIGMSGVMLVAQIYLGNTAHMDSPAAISNENRNNRIAHVLNYYIIQKVLAAKE